MGLLKRDKPADKLPNFAFRGRNEETGKKQNYLLRYECPVCQGIYRSASGSDHKCRGQ
jgi:hypothetical protein